MNDVNLIQTVKYRADPCRERMAFEIVLQFQTLCLKRLGFLFSLRLRSMKKCVALAVSSGVMSHMIRKESQVTSQIWMLQGVERGASISVFGPQK